MPSRKRKTKSKQTKSKSSTSKQKKASRQRRAVAPKRTAKKKQLRKKTSSGPSRNRKTAAHRSQRLESSLAIPGPDASVQSGDLEGLSRAEQADSESVDELVEEGNVFEAGAVAGVQEADDQDTREVHTHEVPEDDVPDEYLDKD